MRIGILTHFHKSTNYGGVLQAYALCRFLNDQGHSAKQILYKHSVITISTTHMTCKKLFEKVRERIKKKIYHKRNLGIKHRMEASFLDFRESVPHTCQEYTSETIKNVISNFDIFITGSDQVWNPIWFDPAYMLQFVGDSAPKISYAASMGVGVLDQEQELVFKSQISDFAGVSVREKTASDILTTLIGKEVKVCVDPTLLLSVNEWEKIASERLINEKYVFLYLFGEGICVRKLAQSFAEFHGMKLVVIPDLLGKYRKNDRIINSEIINDATPSGFISLIKYADYVLTDSFHACVFSLLYHKEFFAFPRDGHIKMESRIVDLMNMFECSERYCVEKDSGSLNYLLSCVPIDYTREFKAFENAKQESVDYLLKYIS